MTDSDARRASTSLARNNWLRAFVLVVVVLLLADAVFWVLVLRRIDYFELDATQSDGGTTYLLIGSDSRSFVADADARRAFGDTDIVPGERADTLLLLRIDTEGEQSVWVLPRDLLVVSEEGFQTRLGLTYEDGPQAVVDALCSELGLGVRHVVVADFPALRQLVDAVGGVDVHIDAPMRDVQTGLMLPHPGEVRLDGDAALAYARSRTAELLMSDRAWVPQPDGEGNRQTRSVEMLAALGEEVEAASWPSPTFHRAGSAAADSIRFSSTMGVRDILRLRDALGDMDEAFTLSVDRHTIGEVPIATLNAFSHNELEQLGTFPEPCTSAQADAP